MGNYLQWLFTDPLTAGGGTTQQPFPYYTLWFVLIGITILVPLYYWLEGRRRITWIKDHYVWKQQVLDRLTQHIAWWGGIAAVVLAFRYISPSTPFAWPIWFGLLFAWAAVIIGYWLYYFIRHHNGHLVAFERQRERQKFLKPMNRAKRRAASAR